MAFGDPTAYDQMMGQSQDPRQMAAYNIPNPQNPMWGEILKGTPGVHSQRTSRSGKQKLSRKK